MNIKIEPISGLQNFYNSNLFWIIGVVAGSSYALFKDINNCIIHNYILPILLLCSIICITSFMFYLKNYIYNVGTFNKFYKWISTCSKLTDTEIINAMNDCNIQYKINGDTISPKLSKITNTLKWIFEITFWLSILVFISLFICMYYNLL